MARRRRSRLRKRARMHVRKRLKLLTFSLLLLLSLALIAFHASKWAENYEMEISALVHELEQADMLADPARYLSLSRSLSYKQVEPLLYLLLLAVPSCVAFVGIITIYKSKERTEPKQRDYRPKKVRIDERRSQRGHLEGPVERYDLTE